MPGCSLRQVVAIGEPGARELRTQGAVVKLACGHEQWIAGFDERQRSNIVRFNSFVPCLESPCYRPQTEMSS